MKTTFEFNLDNKVTVWNRTIFSIEANSEEEAQEKIKELIKSKQIDEHSIDEIDLIEGIKVLGENILILETTENMTALENNAHVIEIMNNNYTFHINENLEKIG
jgi:hypothetical protein